MHIGLQLLSDTSGKLNTATLGKALKYLLAIVARSPAQTGCDTVTPLGRLVLQLAAEICAAPGHKRSKELSTALVSVPMKLLSRKEASELMWTLNQLLSATSENGGAEVVPRKMAATLSKLQRSLSSVLGSADDDLLTPQRQAEIEQMFASARERLEVITYFHML